MSVDESLITSEVMGNTLVREVWPEVRVVAPPKMGKVRTVYDVGGEQLVLVSSDNLSTHDVVHKRQVYGKGDNLDAISVFYFDLTRGFIPNHFIRTLGPNTWLTHKASPILVEMVFRGYITGSAWDAYVEADGQKKGMDFCGVKLRPGYRRNEKLDEVIFTPTAKGQVKDFNIPEFAGMSPDEDDPKLNLDIIRRNFRAFGLRKPEDIEFLRDVSLEIYGFIHSDLQRAGHLFADTKWEFGYLPDGTIVLIDECVTPDSSRFWRVAQYNFNPASDEFTIVQADKQPFRDYVKGLGLHTPDKKAELAAHWMADDVLRAGIVRYGNIREEITGTPMRITTKPRKQEVLEALASAGFLK